MEASLRRIEEHLGTVPTDAPHETAESWKLPDTQQKLADEEILRREPADTHDPITATSPH